MGVDSVWVGGLGGVAVEWLVTWQWPLLTMRGDRWQLKHGSASQRQLSGTR